jgi:hypothetical protein
VSTISVQQGKHLTPNEVETLIAAAKTNRYGLRYGLAILLAYRHGLRSSEFGASTSHQSTAVIGTRAIGACVHDAASKCNQTHQGAFPTSHWVVADALKVRALTLFAAVHELVSGPLASHSAGVPFLSRSIHTGLPQARHDARG